MFSDGNVRLCLVMVRLGKVKSSEGRVLKMWLEFQKKQKVVVGPVSMKMMKVIQF